MIRSRFYGPSFDQDQKKQQQDRRGREPRFFHPSFFLCAVLLLCPVLFLPVRLFFSVKPFFFFSSSRFFPARLFFSGKPLFFFSSLFRPASLLCGDGPAQICSHFFDGLIAFFGADLHALFNDIRHLCRHGGIQIQFLKGRQRILYDPFDRIDGNLSRYHVIDRSAKGIDVRPRPLQAMRPVLFFRRIAVLDQDRGALVEDRGQLFF